MSVAIFFGFCWRRYEMSREPPESPTLQLLREAAGGSERAAEDLFPLLYGELRRLAKAWMSKLPAGQTLQPTALVHEAYLRLGMKINLDGWHGQAIACPCRLSDEHGQIPMYIGTHATQRNPKVNPRPRAGCRPLPREATAG